MGKPLTSRFMICFVGLLSSCHMMKSSQNYVVEVRAVVDLAGIERWTYSTGKTIQDFRSEINKTFKNISEIFFKSLASHGVLVEVAMKDLVLLEHNILDSTGKDLVNCWRCLTSFKDWVLVNNTLDTNQKYDLSILFTGHDLFFTGPSDANVTLGYSYVGMVCYPMGVGVVELSGTSQDAFIAAHEIGHILGARHDGTKGLASSCSGQAHYIMSPAPNITETNHLYFSRCSAQAIQDKIRAMDGSKRNCLTSGRDVG